MKKKAIRILSFAMVLVMAFCSVPLSSFAKAEESTVKNASQARIEETNSLSSLLAQTADMSEISMDSPYYISEMTFSGNTATVRYYNESDCKLIVAVYDEETQQMLDSGIEMVYAESITAEVKLNIAMPKYFIAKAFLVDENNAPLCEQFTCRTYTSEYEQIESLTVNDFEPEQVINLDKKDDSNFIALANDVIKIAGSKTVNVLSSVDKEKQKYTLTNIDNSVKNLKSGDRIYLDNGDFDNLLAIEIKSISISGTTAVIVSNGDITEDIFDCIKIDSASVVGNSVLDMSEADESVSYVGDVDFETGEAIKKTSADIETSSKISKEFKIIDKEKKSASGRVEGKINGKVDLSLKFTFKATIKSGYKEVAFTIDPAIKVEFKAEGKIDLLKIPLAKIKAYPVPGVEIGFEPAFVVRISGEVSATATLTFTLGLGYNSKDGFINKCKKPSLKVEFKAELTIFIGIDLQPYAAAITKKIANVSMTGEVGAEAKGTMTNNDGSASHTCKLCIDGDLTGKMEIKASAVFLEDTSKELKAEKVLFKFEFKIGDFYYSISHGEFGWGSCPYRTVEFTVKVTDSKGKAIKDATVSSSYSDFIYEITDKNGVVKLKTNCTSIILTVEAYGYKRTTRQIDVREDSEKFYVTVRKSGVSTSDGTGSNDGTFKGTESTGSFINFGSYPQTKVTNSDLISKLNGCSKTWESYEYYSGTGNWDDGKMVPSDYMKYADFKYNGNKYRAVKFTKYRPCYTGYTCSAGNSYQDDNGYKTNTVYYFKFEPLKWRILDSSQGLVMCESIIDSQAFNNFFLRSNAECYGSPDKLYYASDYGFSSIREWLNDDFYNTAFSPAQQSKIQQNVTVDAKCTDSSSYDGTTTSNNEIFLLSWWDAVNSNYGFNSDNSRCAKGTDYAKCQGLWVNTGSFYNGNSGWRLRSPYGSGSTRYVNFDGYVYYDYNSAHYPYGGVRPAFKFNLKSKISQSSIGDNTASKAENEELSVLCSACEAGGEYILLNVLDYGEDFTLSSDNLLYIDELKADENGTVATKFLPKEYSDNATTLLVGDFGNGIEAKKVTAKKPQIPQINSDCEVLTVSVGETKQLPMTVVNPDKAYFNGRMRMQNGKIASATSSNGIIYIKGVGVGETKFRLYFNEKITGKTVAYKDFTIKVVNTPTTVSMISSLELNYKDDYTFKPKIETADGVTYKTSYKSSNTGVASASDNGYIYACGKGDTKITCTVTDSNGNTVTASCNVTVRYAWWQWLIKILLFGWIWY